MKYAPLVPLLLLTGGGVLVSYSPTLTTARASAVASVRVSPVHLKDLNGKNVVVPVPGAKVTVVALTGTTCPAAQRYGPTLSKLEAAYSGKGVRFVFLNPSPVESPADMQAQIKRLGLTGPYLHETATTLARTLQAKTTTESFVLDAQGQIRYRGAIDDQYGIGTALPAPRNRFLINALDAVLAGKSPKVASTNAPGCLLDLASAPKKVVPTFHAKIQPLLQEKCVSCHHGGGVGPFSLDTYDAVKARASMIRYVVDKKIMPPWFASKDCGGPWRNDLSLSDEEKKTLYSWIDGGMPKGNAADAPKPVQYEAGWNIGRPDVVYQLPEPISIQATGVMPYKVVNVATNLTEDKWVQKIEVVPGDKRVVHHVLVWARVPGAASNRTADQLEEISGFFGEYVPGSRALIYPDGLAKKLPKGSTLRFQIHYTPNGTATTDQTKIGLVFAKQPPRHAVHTASLANLRFTIPAGADNQEVKAQMRVPFDAQILSYLPHMHVRGKAAKYELTRDGKTTTLLDVPRYDFNWQLNYVLQEPLDVKAGDQLTYTAWYDNSAKNPANPDPAKTVRWGSQTFDEMHLGYLEYIIPGEDPNTAGRALPNPAIGNSGIPIEAIFGGLDKNKDGFVDADEARALWQRIKVADANTDGKISLDEAKTFFGGQ